MYKARIDSPFGSILLCAVKQGLQGLYFLDQQNCSSLVEGLAPRPSLRPSSGELNGVPLRTLRAVQRAKQVDYGAQTALFTPERVLSHGDNKTQVQSAPALNILQEQTPDEIVDLFACVREQLREYFSGQRKSFSFPLSLLGTPYQLKIWNALCQVPYGEVSSYGQLGLLAGLTPGHGRSVGMAVGRNPVSIVVPCHRIVGSNHRLTGYSGGLARKVALLALEGVELA